MVQVTDNGTVSEAYAVTNGVKKGCIPGPILYGLMFTLRLMAPTVMSTVPRDSHRRQPSQQPGVCVAVRVSLPSAAREVPGNADPPLYYIRGLHESLRHGDPPLSCCLPVRLTFLVDTLLGRAGLVTSLASAPGQSTLSPL
nr:unnamed protein product [Spirometra erinaceieuropaei]